MRKKIFFHYFLVGVLAVVLCCGLLLGVLFHHYEGQIFRQMAVEAEYIAHGMELSGEGYLDTMEFDDRVTWVSAAGDVLYDSQAEAADMANHLDRQEIGQALEQGSGQSTHYSETLLERTLYYAQRLEDGTVIRVACTQGTVMAMLLMLLGPIFGVMAVVLTICALLAFRLAKAIVEPINRVDLDHPVIDKTYSELAPLVSRIRQQNQTIRLQMEELGRKQREFTAITENMSEGFLLVDPKTNILSSNQAAIRLLSGGDRMENLRRDSGVPAIRDAVDAALAGMETDRIIALEGRSWQLLAHPVTASGQVAGAVVLLMDVTEKAQREELRKEFSANVSHELKTPLTSISGFAELMKEGMVPLEKCREFAGDIYRESRRLIDLVDDIIRLSRLDESSRMFEPEEVDLYDLSDDILANLRPVAEKSGVSLSLKGGHVRITGVWQILNEMVYNLCDNAIKYNREEGSVTVEVGRSGGEACLTVSDTGIGIPYADQSRVFERFYRVDKSHSKEMGGTGLGLSIVKHGAQYHNARLELRSELGKGTSISILFPQALA